jgi:hypothetical protein
VEVRSASRASMADFTAAVRVSRKLNFLLLKDTAIRHITVRSPRWRSQEALTGSPDTKLRKKFPAPSKTIEAG